MEFRKLIMLAALVATAMLSRIAFADSGGGGSTVKTWFYPAAIYSVNSRQYLSGREPSNLTWLKIHPSHMESYAKDYYTIDLYENNDSSKCISNGDLITINTVALYDDYADNSQNDRSLGFVGNNAKFTSEQALMLTELSTSCLASGSTFKLRHRTSTNQYVTDKSGNATMQLLLQGDEPNNVDWTAGNYSENINILSHNSSFISLRGDNLSLNSAVPRVYLPKANGSTERFTFFPNQTNGIFYGYCIPDNTQVKIRSISKGKYLKTSSDYMWASSNSPIAFTLKNQKYPGHCIQQGNEITIQKTSDNKYVYTKGDRSLRVKSSADNSSTRFAFTTDPDNEAVNGNIRKTIRQLRISAHPEEYDWARNSIYLSGDHMKMGVNPSNDNLGTAMQYSFRESKFCDNSFFYISHISGGEVINNEFVNYTEQFTGGSTNQYAQIETRKGHVGLNESLEFLFEGSDNGKCFSNEKSGYNNRVKSWDPDDNEWGYWEINAVPFEDEYMQVDSNQSYPLKMRFDFATYHN